MANQEVVKHMANVLWRKFIKDIQSGKFTGQANTESYGEYVIGEMMDSVDCECAKDINGKGSIGYWMHAFAEFRGEVRCILGRNGLYINFADSDDAILRGIEKVIIGQKNTIKAWAKTQRSIKEEAWDKLFEIFTDKADGENIDLMDSILIVVKKERADDEKHRAGGVKPAIGKRKNQHP